MTPDEYQQATARFDNHRRGEAHLAALALGLCAESAEVLKAVLDTDTDTDAICAELGDCLWNIARIDDHIGLETFTSSPSYGRLDSLFAQVHASVQLAMAAGTVANQVERLLRASGWGLNTTVVSVHLGLAKSRIAALADSLGLSLEQVMERNIAKLTERYAGA